MAKEKQRDLKGDAEKLVAALPAASRKGVAVKEAGRYVNILKGGKRIASVKGAGNCWVRLPASGAPTTAALKAAVAAKR